MSDSSKLEQEEWKTTITASQYGHLMEVVKRLKRKFPNEQAQQALDKVHDTLVLSILFNLET